MMTETPKSIVIRLRRLALGDYVASATTRDGMVWNAAGDAADVALMRIGRSIQDGAITPRYEDDPPGPGAHFRDLSSSPAPLNDSEIIVIAERIFGKTDVYSHIHRTLKESLSRFMSSSSAPQPDPAPRDETALRALDAIRNAARQLADDLTALLDRE